MPVCSIFWIVCTRSPQKHHYERADGFFGSSFFCKIFCYPDNSTALAQASVLFVQPASTSCFDYRRKIQHDHHIAVAVTWSQQRLIQRLVLLLYRTQAPRALPGRSQCTNHALPRLYQNSLSTKLEHVIFTTVSVHSRQTQFV